MNRTLMTLETYAGNAAEMLKFGMANVNAGVTMNLSERTWNNTSWKENVYRNGYVCPATSGGYWSLLRYRYGQKEDIRENIGTIAGRTDGDISPLWKLSHDNTTETYHC